MESKIDKTAAEKKVIGRRQKKRIAILGPLEKNPIIVPCKKTRVEDCVAYARQALTKVDDEPILVVESHAILDLCKVSCSCLVESYGFDGCAGLGLPGKEEAKNSFRTIHASDNSTWITFCSLPKKYLARTFSCHFKFTEPRGGRQDLLISMFELYRDIYNLPPHKDKNHVIRTRRQKSALNQILLRPLFKIDLRKPILGCQVFDDGPKVVVGCHSGRTKIHDLQTQEAIAKLWIIWLTLPAWTCVLVLRKSCWVMLQVIY